MPIALDSLAALAALPFDEVIDVRSPAEFAEDHIPGAINLPALSNEERAHVGTIYVQQDRFLARKIGAALVARNAAAHLEGPLADRHGGWRPLVYCWRGGQRSGSFTVILQQIGWKADTIQGGYQSYRRLVVRALYEEAFPAPITLIDGGTGTGKTHLLSHLAAQGAQVIDLEHLAAHRGSVFGPVAGGQPSQKSFESALAAQMARLDPTRPVYIEAESTRIGRINLPPMLTSAMRVAPVIRLEVPLAARVSHLCADYTDLIADPDRLDAILTRLVQYHGHAQVDQWRALAATGDFPTLVTQLIETHYDPRYIRKPRPEGITPLDLPDLSEATLHAAARNLIKSA
ncbi:MAG: tRNA 2-selenouridine synthase [Roseovarius sp. BRH_c41]|uniref:tRNA 2-selenouridine(34) synthase MnmH n=1 Tax=Roseovarius sp. BRH_c41 TaxID=1629709 RepID=UPI0005F132B6|nr:tRNA 2-selenouridine(34) synthase MnmH [Roseovarius sp. BRH_c41]KJS45305.1 MAG: tRNA 2-selenouridine synthase [Roseovarius sp. BRH_c41]